MSEHELRVALDIGSKKHRVGIANDDGRIIEEFDITHDKAGFESFFRQVEANRNDLLVVVAMEGLNGWARPLDRMIQKRGYELLNVNNVKLARFKEIFPGPAKTDKIDTRKTLELMHMRKVLPLAKTVLHRVGHTPVENEQLKRYTRRRRQLVDDKVRVLNRLQSDVQAVSPGLLEITGEAGNLWFLHLLTCREDLRKIAGMRRPGLLKIRGVGQAYATKIESWQGSATFSDEIEWVGPMIIADAQRVLDLTRQVQALEKLIVTINASSTIARRIETIPGFGPISSATLAGELGNLDRFEAETSLALYSGMTRLDNSSGQFTGSKNTRQVNTHAKAAMMVAVARHIDNVPESRAYYDKKRAEGKTHNQAIRALGRHLIRVIWSMLKHDRDYVPKAERLAKIA
jgi:transposase